MALKYLPFLFVIIFGGCIQIFHSSSDEESQETDQSVQVEIIGKTIEYKYGESIYHVHIDTESKMHWEAMAGDEKGVKANETYKIDRLDDQTLFITWGEENGIGVSQVLDFENGIVYNHLLRDRDITIGRGEVRLLD